MTPLPNRTGPFWDGVHGRTPMPPAAATLGLQFTNIDRDRGTIELAFEATKAFTNPMGNVLGAYLAAMLYDTVGPALLATLEADQFQSILDINVRFLRTAPERHLLRFCRTSNSQTDHADAIIPPTAVAAAECVSRVRARAGGSPTGVGRHG